MMANKTRKGRAIKTNVTGDGANQKAERFKRLGKSSSQIVRDAAALLDEEIAAGIVTAKQIHRRFQKEQRLDPTDFKETLQRFQSDAHAIVNQVNDRLSEVRSEESADLLKRFIDNTHDLLDLTVELVNTGAEIADRLVQSNLPKKRNARTNQQRSRR